MKKFLLTIIMALAALPAFAGIEIRGGTNFNTIIANGDTTPSTLDGTDFGEVVVPGSKTVSFQVKAIGVQETISGIVEDGTAWSIASGGGFGALPAGATRTFSVKLEPTSAGFKNATVTILTVGGTYSFKVNGNGVGDPEIVVRGQLFTGQPFTNLADGDTTPNTIDGTAFGGQGVNDGSISHTFQIENTGTDQLIIDSITDDSSEFSISGAPSTVGVGNTATFTVKFNPTSFGTKTATITIRNNDPDGGEDPYTFSVNGIGEASQIQVFGGDSQNITINTGDTTPRTTDNTDFGTVAAGSAPVTKVFKIKNNGNETLFVTVVSEDTNAFSITGAPTISNPILPGNSDNINIILDADVAGTKYGTVTIISNDPDNGVFTFDITAEATGDPEIVVRGRLNAALNFIEIPNNDTTPVPTDGTDFGSKGVNDGYIEHIFQIENTGTAKLNIASITDDSSAFSIVDVPSAVAVGNTQTFGVRFDPGAFGEKTATITIDNDDPDGGEDPYTFQVTGLGLFAKAQIYGGSNFGEFIANNDDSPVTIDGSDFGTVDAGISTKTNTFRIKNEGNETLTVLGVTENGSAFSIATSPTIPAAIAPGGSRDFSILFAPTSAGSKSATVTVLTSDTVQGRDTYSFDIIGEASGVAEFTVAGRQVAALPYQEIANGDITPTPLDGTDFGSQGVADGGLTRTFQITNTGSAQLTIDSITEGSPNFSLANIPTIVGVNQTKTFDVIFNPSSFGTKTANIKITTNADDEESFTFKVTGLGEAPQIEVYGGINAQNGLIPNGSVAPGDTSSQDFSDFGIVGDVVSRAFAIKNTGNTTLTILSAIDDGVAWDVDPLTLVQILPGAIKDFGIELSPVSAGYKAANIVIQSSDPATPTYTFEVFADLEGESDLNVYGSFPGSPVPVIVPDGATNTTTGNGTDFGDRGVADGGISHTFEIFNPGSAKLNINSITETSPHFSISNAPTSVGVNQTQTFTVTFNPTSLGLKSTSIVIDSDALGGKALYTFEISGIGEAPDIAITGGTNFATNISNGDAIPDPTDGTDFGLVNVDSTVVTRTFRIENTGNETLFILSALSDNNEFTLAGVPTITNPITPGGVNEFTVAFDPANTGLRSATIIIQSNDPDEDPFTFVVEGFGSDDTPNIKLIGEAGDAISDGQVADTASTDFQTVDIGGPTQSRTFTIENDGTGTLTITSVTENGARFNIVGAPTDPIEPGESADFEVRFNPNNTDPQVATVTIISNDPDKSPFTFSVTGTGSETTPPPAPEIAVKGGQALSVNIGNGDTTPRRFDGTDVGSVLVGGSKQRTFQIQNTGDADLNISQVILVGAPGAVASFPSLVPAGGTGEFTVTLAPNSAGQKTFILRIDNDDADEGTFTFAITGLGVDPVNMLSIQDFKIAGANLEITFVSDPNKTYLVAYSFDLDSWVKPAGLRGIEGDITAQTYIITGVANPANPKIFLRVEEE